MKEVYRRGLGWRYGRMMQAISGVHYNYSFPAHFWPVLAASAAGEDADQDFISAQYFGLLRNYRRYGWLVLYLFGNSPALCGLVRQGPRASACSSSRPARCTSRTQRRCA
jgi:glutamate--cysteine ligase